MRRTVRAATQEDVDKILTIQAETGISFWSEDDYRAEFQNPDSICWCIEKAGVVSGFILIRLVRELTVSNTVEFSEAEILNLAISRRSHREGMGSELFSTATEELRRRRVQSIWLEVRESNFQAINFYLKNGFINEYMRQNYYLNPQEDAIVMKKLL
jgi:ribosomal-protein-alanine acetyltransferase